MSQFKASEVAGVHERRARYDDLPLAEKAIVTATVRKVQRILRIATSEMTDTGLDIVEKMWALEILAEEQRGLTDAS